ncbi:unnamed protein product, partial [Amoebophrya sp. A25]
FSSLDGRQEDQSARELLQRQGAATQPTVVPVPVATPSASRRSSSSSTTPYYYKWIRIKEGERDKVIKFQKVLGNIYNRSSEKNKELEDTRVDVGDKVVAVKCDKKIHFLHANRTGQELALLVVRNNIRGKKRALRNRAKNAAADGDADGVLATTGKQGPQGPTTTENPTNVVTAPSEYEYDADLASAVLGYQQ